MNELVDQPEETILERLLRHGLLPDAAGWHILPATGGLNSRVFFVGPKDHPPALTVRMSHPGKQDILVREQNILRELAGSCACVPALRGLIRRETDALLAHDYAPGAPMPLASASGIQLATLGACLANIHAHERDHYVIWPDVDENRGSRAQTLVARLGAVERYTSFNSSEHESLLRSVWHVYHQIQRGTLNGEGWDERRFARLHGDLSPGNIIWDDDRITLIDWEYSRTGDPAEDLAYLLGEQDVPEEKTRILLDSYVAAGGDATAVSRVPTYAALVSLDSALWWADLNLDRGDDPSSSSEVAYHLSRARAALPGD